MNEIYDMLSLKSDPQTLAKGIGLAKQVGNLHLLIQPPAPPAVWERCADILSQKSDEELEPYIYELLEWLQDLNYPGALTIVERLKAFSGEKLAEAFVDAVHSADNLDKVQGSRWMLALSELLDNAVLKEHLQQDIVDKLTECRHKCGRED